MLVGLVVTRVGCFLNGCCAGRPTTGWLALELPDHRGVRARRIPNQLLDGGWGLVVLAGAVWLWGERPFPGALLLYTIGAYGAGRIVLESLRDAPDRLGAIHLHRAISIGFVAVSLVAFVIVSTR